MACAFETQFIIYSKQELVAINRQRFDGIYVSKCYQARTNHSAVEISALV